MSIKYRNTLIVLGTMIAMLVILVTQAGPRVRSSRVDLLGVVNATSSRFVLNMTEQIDAVNVADIHISPQITFTVTTSGKTVIIEFDKPLYSSNSYKVYISRLTSSRTKKHTSFEREIKTPALEVLYIKRQIINSKAGAFYDTDQIDAVRMKTIGMVGEKTIYEDKKIDEIATYGDTVAVTLPQDDGSHILRLVDISSGKFRDVDFLHRGAIKAPKFTQDGSLLGFSYLDNSKKGDDRVSVLTFYDLRSKTMFSLKDIGGSVLRSANWILSNDGGIYAAINEKGGLVVGNLNELDEPQYYGNASELTGFSADTLQLYFNDTDGPTLLELSTGKKQPIRLQLTDSSDALLINSVPFYGTKNAFYTRRARYSYLESKYYEQLITTIDKNDSIKKEYLVGETNIINITSSIDDKFAYVEVSDANSAQYDNYLGARRPSNVKTEVIDISTGAVIETIDGFRVEAYRK